MRKKLHLFFYFLSFYFLCYLPICAQDRILGKWINEKKDIVLEIYKEGNTFFGKIVWLKDIVTNKQTLQSSSNNIQQVSCGTDILSNILYSNDNVWDNGHLYDFRTNRTQNCQLWLDKNNDDMLYIKTYSILTIFGTTTVWRRPETSHPVYTTRQTITTH